MSKSYKPENHTAVAPYFVTDDAERLIQLVTDIFGATKLRFYHDDSGRVFHAELKLDDSVIMIGNTPEGGQPVPIVIHVYVADVDATYNKAISLGCEPVEPPDTRENDPDKRGSFRDFQGNWWSVATQR